MNRLLSTAALAALLWCFGASAAGGLHRGGAPAGLRLEDARPARVHAVHQALFGQRRGARRSRAAIGRAASGGAMVEALDALAAGNRLRGASCATATDLRCGYERSFTAAGDPIEVGRVLWPSWIPRPEARSRSTASGRASRPTTFWLSTARTRRHLDPHAPRERRGLFGLRHAPPIRSKQPLSSGAARPRRLLPGRDPRARHQAAGCCATATGAARRRPASAAQQLHPPADKLRRADADSG